MLNQSYDGQVKFYLAVDCIVFGFDGEQIKLLLFKRKIEPLKGEWSLVGSFIKEGLTIKESATKILEESTGLEDIFLEELKTYSDVNRDPAERVISTAYYSLIRLNELRQANLEKYDAKWFGLDEIPDLILDHQDMVNDAFKKLQIRLKRRPIGFRLLPEKFTLPQIQTMYECVLQKELDTRNFRKKLLSFEIMQKLDEKDKSSSKKGAYYYKFDKERYDQFVEKGFNFDLIPH